MDNLDWVTLEWLEEQYWKNPTILPLTDYLTITKSQWNKWSKHQKLFPESKFKVLGDLINKLFDVGRQVKHCTNLTKIGAPSWIIERDDIKASGVYTDIANYTGFQLREFGMYVPLSDGKSFVRHGMYYMYAFPTSVNYTEQAICIVEYNMGIILKCIFHRVQKPLLVTVLFDNEGKVTRFFDNKKNNVYIHNGVVYENTSTSWISYDMMSERPDENNPLISMKDGISIRTMKSLVVDKTVFAFSSIGEYKYINPNEDGIYDYFECKLEDKDRTLENNVVVTYNLEGKLVSKDHYKRKLEEIKSVFTNILPGGQFPNIDRIILEYIYSDLLNNLNHAKKIIGACVEIPKIFLTFCSRLFSLSHISLCDNCYYNR